MKLDLFLNFLFNSVINKLPISILQLTKNLLVLLILYYIKILKIINLNYRY
jgi:hypothetical protein